MAASDTEIFTFTWRIEHFSFCPQAVCGRISSPPFVVNFLKSEWDLWLYPRGHEKHENCIQCFLHIIDAPFRKTAIGFAITILSVAGKEIKKTDTHVFEKSCGKWGFFNVCSREDIFNISNGYLPNDTLTVKFGMWKIADEKNDVDSLNAEVDVPDKTIVYSDLMRQIHFSIARDDTLDLRSQFGYNQCTVVTRIEMGSKSVLWPIKRFCELRPKKKLAIYVPTSMKAAPSFLLTLYVSEDKAEFQNVQIEIQIDPKVNTEKYFVKCKMVAFHPLNRIRFEKGDEHLFLPDTEKDVWKFPDFIDVKCFKNEKCLHSNQDVMYLRCEFDFSLPWMSHAEKTHVVAISNEKLLSNGKNSTGPLFGQICYTEKFSDIVIRTGNHEFKAHKVILSAHSTVFTTMFENDMVEKQSGVVEIEDIEENILASMLHFMYGGELKIVDPKDAEKLYSAADKYDISPLKWLCACYLISNLCVSNVCSMLTLADLHLDDDLMEEVKRFIRLHATEVFHSSTWVEFMKSKHELAGDIMLNMLKNLNFF